MKQGKPLQRKTPLRAKRPMDSKKPMGRGPAPTQHQNGQQRTPRPTRTPQRKLTSTPPKTTPEERRTRRVVDERSDGFCEKCGTPGATDKAHRVARGVGGEWSPSNILDLCRACHTYHHKNPEVAYRGGWHLQANSIPTKCPVWFHHEGIIGLAHLHDDGTHTWVQEAEATA